MHPCTTVTCSLKKQAVICHPPPPTSWIPKKQHWKRSTTVYISVQSWSLQQSALVLFVLVFGWEKPPLPHCFTVMDNSGTEISKSWWWRTVVNYGIALESPCLLRAVVTGLWPFCFLSFIVSPGFIHSVGESVLYETYCGKSAGIYGHQKSACNLSRESTKARCEYFEIWILYSVVNTFYSGIPGYKFTCENYSFYVPVRSVIPVGLKWDIGKRSTDLFRVTIRLLFVFCPEKKILKHPVLKVTCHGFGDLLSVHMLSLEFRACFCFWYLKYRVIILIS